MSDLTDTQLYDLEEERLSRRYLRKKRNYVRYLRMMYRRHPNFRRRKNRELFGFPFDLYNEPNVAP